MVNKNRLPTFDSKAIAEACKEKSWVEVQAEFNCSRSTVSNACLLYNVMPFSSIRNRAQKLGDYIKANPTADLSQVATAVNMASVSVRSYCRKYGFPEPPAPKKRTLSPSTFEILAHLMKGVNQATIADELFISRQRVQQVHKAAETAGILPKYQRDKQEVTDLVSKSTECPWSEAPWHIVGEDIADCNGVFVATTTGEVESETEKPNLALLVRAPDLVKLLDNMTAALTACLATFSLDMFAADVQSREAMVKAAKLLLNEVRGTT